MSTTIRSVVSGAKWQVTKPEGGDGDPEVAINVTDHDAGNRIFKVADVLNAMQAEGILDAVEIITELPEVTVTENPPGMRNIVKSGGTTYYYDTDPEKVLKYAKELLAIHKHLAGLKAREEEAKAAEAACAATRAARRDELAKQFGTTATTKFYCYCSDLAKNAIDHIIDLEEAAK